jgi:hypothetical protein
MEQRRFGTSGLSVSVLSYGTMTIGGRDRFGKMGNLGVSEPFSSSARTQADSSAELSTRSRNGIAVEVCSWPGAKRTRASRQQSTRDIDTRKVLQ